MSKPQEPLPAKLIVGLIYRPDRIIQESVWRALEKCWGPVEYLSPQRPFTFTSYYDKEMGKPLLRRWGSFKQPVPQDKLVEIKWITLGMELKWTEENRRAVNIDPGLLSAERLVLSTGKNYSHRIYLGRGIFADLTLIFSKGSFQPLAWTFPDYRDPQTVSMFNLLRERHLRTIKKP